ncbi:hypothetical protein J4439_06830, partial [Candidatus Woesearchaeota archaeon]|nr:hypothetical protein [Candidatus Woesearchaeota archaeon]
VMADLETLMERYRKTLKGCSAQIRNSPSSEPAPAAGKLKSLETEATKQLRKLIREAQKLAKSAATQIEIYEKTQTSLSGNEILVEHYYVDPFGLLYGHRVWDEPSYWSDAEKLTPAQVASYLLHGPKEAYGNLLAEVERLR